MVDANARVRRVRELVPAAGAGSGANMRDARRVVVVGGGIGGLTAAIALARRRLTVAVLERSSQMREIGAGITLWSNALRALRRIGLDGPVAREGTVLQGGDVTTWRGRVLLSTDIAAMAAELGAPSVAIPRPALQRVLLEHLPAGSLRTGATVEQVREEGEEVVVLLGDGSQVRGDVLVGADGFGSTVRRHLHGDAPPRYAGYTCWRAIVDLPEPWGRPGRALEVWGPGLRIGAVPLGERRLYWFASRNAPEGEPFDAVADLARLRNEARGWASPVPQVLDALRPELLLRHDIRDREPLRPWARGRVTLLGDAAHPMTPNLGQGACAAVEDALVLADRLAEEDDAASALRRYEAQRGPRTAHLVRRARFLGRVGQEASPFLGGVRNLLMRMRPQSSYRRELRSFLDYDTEHPSTLAAGRADRDRGGG